MPFGDGIRTHDINARPEQATFAAYGASVIQHTPGQAETLGEASELPVKPLLFKGASLIFL